MNHFKTQKEEFGCNNISGQFFYVEEGKMQLFIDFENNLGQGVADFFVDEKHLYVFGVNHIYKVNLENKKQELLFEGQVSTPLIRKKYALFVHRNELKKIYYDGTIKTILSDDKIKIDFARGKVFSFNQKIFFLSRNIHKSFIHHIDTLTQKVNKVSISNETDHYTVNTLDERNGKLWLSTNKGLRVYRYEHYLLTEEQTYFEEEFTSKLIVDQYDNYWIGTLHNGIYVIPNINLHQIKKSPTRDYITSLTKIDTDKIALGSIKGEVGMYNMQTGKYQILVRLSNTDIKKLLYMKASKKLIISAGTNSGIFDIQKNVFYQDLNLIGAKDLEIVSSDTFLQGMYSTARNVQLEGTQFKILGYNYRRGRTYTCYYDSIQKQTYIGHIDGLVKYDKDTSYTFIKDQNKNPIYALDIVQTQEGTIWVATFKNGIYKIQNGSVIQQYTVENGLIDDRIKKIVAQENKLWIATEYGLQVLDTNTGKFELLTTKDGIISYEVTDMESVGNTVFIATDTGVFSFDSNKVFKQHTPSPKAYFTQVKINEEAVDLQEKYTLKHDQNEIEVRFNANGFNSKEHIQYQYRLKGDQKSWITTQTGEGYAKYNSVPPGTFVFQVRAKSLTEEQLSLVKEIQFNIQAPFWKQWWFYVLSILLISNGISILFRKKIKEKEKEKVAEIEKIQRDRELVFLKLENLRSQMNPHFIFNALNSIQEFIILNKKDLASDYLGKFADLIRTYLDHSTRGSITLQEEIDCLSIYLELEKNRFEDKFTYQIENQIESADTIEIPTMLLQPYVENALKHGLLHKKENRKLTVIMQYSENQELILCSIEDNGVGRKKAKELAAKRPKHKSFALKATQDRLQLLNYGSERKIGVRIMDLYSELENPTGTRVEITIPYIKS